MATRPITFGEIHTIKEGQWFSDRKSMMEASFHRNWGRGIDGNGKEGTSAIVLSGGYEDDLDEGHEIVYTGAGGNDPNTGKQVADQSWENPGNAGLLVSMDSGFPVRVIRGSNHKSEYSPKEGYLYGGIYSVVDAWEEIGKSGFKICRFKLLYCGSGFSINEPTDAKLNYRKNALRRKPGTVLRIVRDSKIANDVKRLYKFKCQVCGVALKTKKGLYAEGAHIKPLGKPHNGDDSLDNLLCLCPNHHVMFDKGAFSITDDFDLLGAESGKLTVKKNHLIDLDNFAYHRKCHGY